MRRHGSIGRDLGDTDPFDVAAVKYLKRYTDVGVDKERKQKLSAELIVADPNFTGAIFAERQEIDVHRPRSDPLHVVGARIRQRHA